jgi:hypothetical protein
MVLRSDEQANEAEFERDKKFRGNLGKGVAAAASLGTAAVAGPLAARIMPFLNQYIPPALAMKGIEKVSPRLGTFLRKGQEMGLDVEDGLNFLKDKLSKSAEPAKEKRNIIEQYSPELHKFISEEVSKGRAPIEAAAIAQHDKRFSSIINKLSKDHKTPWSSIIDSIYGTGQYGGAVNPPSQNQPQQPMQQVAQQPPQQGQQGGQGQAALLAILQKIQQSRGGQ